MQSNLSIIRTVACGLAGGLLGGAAVWIGQRGSFNLTPVGMTYDQLAATLLAGSALLVTIFGVGIAILALWGFNSMKDGAVRAAKTAAVERVDNQLASGEIRVHVENIVLRFMRERTQDGSLQALVEEQENKENELKTVDDGWGDIDV